MPKTFELNACYTTAQAARILQHHVKTVVKLCQSGRLRAAKHPGGYRITGRAIREYCEGVLPLAGSCQEKVAKKYDNIA